MGGIGVVGKLSFRTTQSSILIRHLVAADTSEESRHDLSLTMGLLPRDDVAQPPPMMSSAQSDFMGQSFRFIAL